MVVGALGVYTQAATALLLAAGGVLAFRYTKSQRHTVSFSLLLILWGAFLLAGNLAVLAFEAGAPGLAQKLLMGHAVVQGVAFLPLAVFGTAYPPSQRRSLTSTPWILALLAPVLAVLAVAIWDPSLFHQGFLEPAASSAALWGPAKLGVFALFRFTVYAVLAHLILTRERSTNPVERTQALYVCLALSLFVGFESAEDLLLFAGPWLAGGPLPTVEGLGFAGTALAGLVVVGVLGVRLLGDEHELSATDRRLACASLFGSVALGLVVGAAVTWGPRGVSNASSIWRVAVAGLLVHAVTRYEAPDAIRAPRWAGIAGGLAAGSALLLGLHVGLEALLGSTMQAAIAVQGLVLGGLGWLAWRRPWMLRNTVRHLKGEPPIPEEAHRGLELYEAAMLSDPDEGRLSRLRDLLSVSRPEHEIVERLAGDETPLERRSPPEVGDVLAGRFELEALVGEGARTRVFRARDLGLDRTVAVKLLDLDVARDPSAVREAMYEARTALKFSHPNLIEAQTIEHDHGQPFLVLEYVSGGTLADRIPDGGLDAQAAASVVEDVLSGLQALHEAGILHRDLKPENVLLAEGGTAKIGDLGLAQPFEPERTQELAPGEDRRRGTPAYMSPEALLGRPASPRSDVYAAGALLVEALRGRHYLSLEAAPLSAVKRTVLEREPSMDGIPPELARVASKALAKAPQDRFASARAFREALIDAMTPGGPAPSRGGDEPDKRVEASPLYGGERDPN